MRRLAGREERRYGPGDLVVIETDPGGPQRGRPFLLFVAGRVRWRPDRRLWPCCFSCASPEQWARPGRTRRRPAP